MGTYSNPSYKVSDVADFVKRAFGDESGVQITDTDIIRWVNAAQEEICSTNQILKGTGTTPMVASDYDYPLHSLDIQNLHSVVIDGSKIEYMSFEDAEQYILKNDPKRATEGTPIFWYEWAGVINFYPTPDKSGTINLYYTKNPTKVTATTSTLSVPDNYFNRVVDYVLAQAYELDENYAAHANKINQFDSKMVSMLEDENQRPVDMYPMITILEEDY